MLFTLLFVLYRYITYAETVHLEESEPVICLYNNQMAVISYFCDLQIKGANDSINRFISKDMYVLVFENDKWVAVAQSYLFVEE